MATTKYLIVGSSHAGLQAAEEIRVHDQESPVTMVTMEEHLPYSPTVLPYVVSGKVEEEIIYLRDENYFKENRIEYLTNKKLTGLDTKANKAKFADGSEIEYEQVLIATGSEPTLPPVEGLKDASFYVLRSMDDARALKAGMEQAKSAVIMGAGLVGMHAAESCAKRDMKTTVVELLPQILPGYFDQQASDLIQRIFAEHGVEFCLGNPVTTVAGKKVMLKDGTELEADLLLVSTGVKSRMEFLAGTGIETDQGILVDEFMRTSVKNVWAAGDVAQAKAFFGEGRVLNPILPDASEQGKIAGCFMVNGEYKHLAPYVGGVPMNTFNFFGNRAFSVGLADETDYEVDRTLLPSGKVYQKMVFADDFLVGFIGMNVPVDPGIVMNVIRRRVDVRERKSEFVIKPLDMNRRIMWSAWRG